MLQPPDIPPQGLPSGTKAVQVFFKLPAPNATKDVEMAALTKAKGNPKVFRYLVQLSKATGGVLLDQRLPHMYDLSLIQDEASRASAQLILDSFNSHQHLAYQKLKTIPHGLFFIPGCPGAGKTYWALRIAALAQMGRQRVPILYLVDINKPVNDVAKRMAQLYHDVGLKKKVIRVHLWPREVSRSFGRRAEGDISTSGPGNEENSPPLNMPSLLPSFVEYLQHSLDSPNGHEKSADRVTTAQTLDEAAWELFQKDPERFPYIHPGIHNIEAMLEPEVEKFRNSLEELYKAALAEADFIATTPVVAAREYFTKSFQPTLVFFDEAAHARELSTLIPIAFHKPEVCIFLGDPRQITPHTNGDHGYREQLQLSAIQRALSVESEGFKAPVSHLNMNRRAYAGLEVLPSSMFYGGNMIPDPKVADEPLPQPVIETREYLNKLRGNSAKVPRLVVSLNQSEWETPKGGTSSWNPCHHEWIQKRIRGLLGASWFKTVDGKRPGSILIVASSKEAAYRYLMAMESWGSESRDRVEVRTVETAAGAQGDIVFVDIVKPSDYIDNKHRLCVAMTRAIQGEVILLSKRMSSARLTRWGREPSVYLKKIWTKCLLAGQVYQGDGIVGDLAGLMESSLSLGDRPDSGDSASSEASTVLLD